MQERYNIFNLIHKALRSMLYHTATAIQHTDFNNREEGAATIAQLEKVLYYFDEHAAHEDTFILPAVERYDQQLVSALESEHVTDLALSKNLQAAIEAWKGEKDGAALLLLGKRIFYAFNAFIAFNLTHMNKEEELLNGVLWQYYSDLEILQIERSLISSIAPDVLMDESRWMMSSINNDEVIGWLTGVRNGAPAEVFNLFLKMAEEELPQNRWRRVKTALTEGLVAVS